MDGLAEVVGETGLVLEVVEGTKGEAGLVVLAEAPVALLVALGVVVPFAADPEAPAVLFPGLADTIPVVALGGPEDGGVAPPPGAGGVVGEGVLPDFKQLLSLLGWMVNICE